MIEVFEQNRLITTMALPKEVELFATWVSGKAAIKTDICKSVPYCRRTPPCRTVVPVHAHLHAPCDRAHTLAGPANRSHGSRLLPLWCSGSPGTLFTCTVEEDAPAAGLGRERNSPSVVRLACGRC